MLSTKKKILISIVFCIISMLLLSINVNAAIKENAETDITENTLIIGITKFESGEVLTAQKIAKATYNDNIFNFNNYGSFSEPVIYYYFADGWYELDEDNEPLPVADQTTLDKLNEPLIYYVNNEEKMIEIEYNPEVEDGYTLSFFTGDETKDELIKYENGILKIPATVNYVGVELIEDETGDISYLETIERENVTDTEYRSTTARVKTLDELKAALKDEIVDTIELQADITGINETIIIDHWVYLVGYDHKLQFNELPENTSGIDIRAEGTTIDSINIEMTAKEGWQGNYGIKVYGTNLIDIYNTTISNADTGILVDGSELNISGITLNDNEFGGIGVKKSDILPDVSYVNVNGWLHMNNESTECPAVWVEGYVGEVNNSSTEFVFTYNEDIPTALGKTQAFYYIDDTLATTIKVSSEAELRRALTIECISEIVLTQSFDVTETFVVDHMVTITGNGNKLTGAENINVFQVDGTYTELTINDTIIETKGSGAAVRIGNAEQGTDFTLRAIIGEDTEITAPLYGIMVYGENSTVDLYGEINITESGYGITGNGLDRYYGRTIINVKEGSTISAPKGYAIYAPQDGYVYIEGGELTGASIVGIKSGTLQITGGELTATGDFVQLPTPTNDGKIPTGDVIAVEVNEKYYGGRNDGNIFIDIVGGTLTSTNGYIIREVNADSSEIGIQVAGTYSNKVEIASDVNVYSASTPEITNINQLKTALLNPAVTEITLTESIENVTESLVADHTVTINGNGNTVTGADNVHVFQVAGTDTVLTINNTKIVANGSGAAVRIGDKNQAVDKTLKAVIGADVEITAYWFGVGIFGENSTVDFYGKINVTEDGYGILGNGGTDYYGKTIINVKEGSKITASKGYAIYAPQDGTVNIEGGELSGASVVAIKAGTLNVTGGTLHATGAFVELPAPSYDGKSATGDVIAVEVNEIYYGGKNDKNIVINVTGGTLISDNAYIIREVNVDSSEIEIEVTGDYSTKQELATNVNAYLSNI